jgi:hypothetical protein
MKCNVGKTDRMIRFGLGIVIIAAGLYYQSWWGLIGIIPMITATLRWCPPYHLLGISTDKK